MAVSQAVLPVGMVGLLVSGIFAATMSSMDSGLNKNAGIFIKNFYQPVLRPHATDRQLLRAGKLTTIVLGSFVILVAWQLSKLKGLSLFDMMVRFGSLVSVPITVVPVPETVRVRAVVASARLKVLMRKVPAVMVLVTVRLPFWVLVPARVRFWLPTTPKLPPKVVVLLKERAAVTASSEPAVRRSAP